MPLYEYECPKCGRFDALQKLSEPPLTVHEVCGSKVRKLMSASSFSFKGSGFYITDYGGKSPAAASSSHEKKPEPKSEACATCPAHKAA